jgi:SAM-dependent methyltransferase
MDNSYHRSVVSLVKNGLQNLYSTWKCLPQNTGYPIDYQGITKKSEPLLLELNRFAGRNVLDIGCNSGLYSYIAGIHAKSILGCDLEQVLIDRAEISRSFFNEFYDSSKVLFHQGSFVDKLSDDIDGIIAACVLYHVGDENLTELIKFLRFKKPLILIQARPARYQAFLKNPSWGGVAATTLYNGMYRIEDNFNFLRDCGYDNVYVTGLNATLFYDEIFPILIAYD